MQTLGYGKFVLLFVLMMLLGSAQAQMRASGTAKCEKGNPEHSVTVPGHADRVFSIAQSKCTWVKPMIIGGMKNKEGVGTETSQTKGNTFKSQTVFVDTMENGDTATYEEQGTGTTKDGVLQSSLEKWTLVDGTGKLKGAKGNGTCSGKGAPDGTSTWQCQGTFTVAKH